MENVDTFEFFECFTIITDWMRSQPIRFGDISFTFMDVFVWTTLAGIAIWFIKKVQE